MVDMKDYIDFLQSMGDWQLQAESKIVDRQLAMAIDYSHRELIDYCKEKRECIKKEFERRCKNIKFV